METGQALPLRRLTAPVARRGYVAVADAEGIVHFLSREDGSFIARLETDGSPVVAPPQKLGNGVLVRTSEADFTPSRPNETNPRHGWPAQCRQVHAVQSLDQVA